MYSFKLCHYFKFVQVKSFTKFASICYPVCFTVSQYSTTPYIKNLNAWESQNTSTENMLFQLSSRKPTKEWKLLDTLAKVVHGLISKWKVLQLIVKIDGKHKCTAGGTWVLVGGIKYSCWYFLYGVKVQKSSLWENLNNIKEI